MGFLTSSLQTATIIPTWLLLIAMVWILPWKGYALWTASKNSQKKWFIILLVVNTLAVLDIIYIFFVNKGKK